MFLSNMRRLVLVALYIVAIPSAQSTATISAECKCMPTDDCWPTVEEWTLFNASISGKLIATIPIASPCHGSDYDAGTCQYLQNHWNQPSLQYVSGLETMLHFDQHSHYLQR